MNTTVFTSMGGQATDIRHQVHNLNDGRRALQIGDVANHLTITGTPTEIAAFLFRALDAVMGADHVD